MAYRLKLKEPVAEGVRRVGLEQIEIAAAKLASDKDVPAAIHDARRCLKRLRALLHLVRPGLDKAAYRREAEQLAAIGKLLSRARDHYVMQHTLAKLETQPGLPKATAAKLKKLVAPGSAANSKAKTADGRRPALARLRQARKLYSGKAIAQLDLDHLVEGLEGTYRKARKAFHKAYAKPSNEAFHAWRKSTQRHWRHMLLLSHGWPEALLARAGEAKELSRLLGDDHDLAVLLTKVTNAAPDNLTRDDAAAIGSLCRSWQTEIRALAEPRGARLFTEPAEELRRRIEAYWSSAGRLAECAQPEERPASRRKPAAAGRRTRRRKTPPAA